MSKTPPVRLLARAVNRLTTVEGDTVRTVRLTRLLHAVARLGCTPADLEALATHLRQSERSLAELLQSDEEEC